MAMHCCMIKSLAFINSAKLIEFDPQYAVAFRADETSWMIQILSQYGLIGRRIKEYK